MGVGEDVGSCWNLPAQDLAASATRPFCRLAVGAPLAGRGGEVTSCRVGAADMRLVAGDCCSSLTGLPREAGDGCAVEERRDDNAALEGGGVLAGSWTGTCVAGGVFSFLTVEGDGVRVRALWRESTWR